MTHILKLLGKNVKYYTYAKGRIEKIRLRDKKI